MAKKSEVTETEKTEVVQEVVPVAPLKLLSFEQWAKKKKIKESHLPGMRAFVQNVEKSRTQAAWDKLFESY
jgi:hypothetical protein